MAAVEVILLLYYLSDIFISIYGIPLIFEWFRLPTFLTDLFLYGKTRGSEKVQTWALRFIEIPKSWFKHYYAYGIVISLYMVTLTIGSYYLNIKIPGSDYIIQAIEHDSREVSIDAHAATIITILMLIQHARRLYESLCVSVYSKGTMNILHYLLGVLLYSTVQFCALAEAPTLNRSTPIPFPKFDESFIHMHWNKVVGVTLFLWASYEHNRAHVILANLRKDRSGQKVIHNQHVLPRGRLFEYLAAPHFICEILLYIAMGLIAWPSSVFLRGPVLFVVINQGLMAINTHRWYSKSFSDYPKQRRALIPFIY